MGVHKVQPRQRQDRIGPWHGKHGTGAMRAHRERKRREAEVRNALTKPERRRAYRRDPEKAAKRQAVKDAMVRQRESRRQRKAKRKGKA